jgi:hypothetical protein
MREGAAGYPGRRSDIISMHVYLYKDVGIQSLPWTQVTGYQRLRKGTRNTELYNL